ncbi:unnamed protein product [Paramecium sonneborni]|uniref:Uncharacterized protein n=1 Tax=Paramecium sonneborni TaxID=65129 RepID=A0A8S1R6N6_9CILI|nr:unnamed protein product [Paramecium sonneborni]
MGNQQFEANESQSNISQYYQKMLNQNKENIPYQYENTPKLLSAESRNKLRPTSKINLDLKLCQKSSEKQLNGLQQKMFQETPIVRNPLEKLHRKRSSTKIVQENDESHIQLLDLLKNMVRHQDSTMQSSQVKVSEQSCQEYEKKRIQIDQDQSYKSQMEDRALQYNNRRRSKTFEESFRQLISNEDRCQPLRQNRRESKEEEALQFILQNCTQTQSRIDQQNSITFESLESDWQALTKKNSKQLETPGTAQFQGLNKDDKMFELSTSNFIEQNNDEYIGSRRPSCMESTFLIPMVLHSQNSLEFDDTKDVYQNMKSTQPYEYKKSPKMNGLFSQQQSQNQLIKLDSKINSTSRDLFKPIKKIIQTQALGLPNKAPLKHKSLHQHSDNTLSLPLQMINSKGNVGFRQNMSFVQNVPQSSVSSKNGRNYYDSRTFKNKGIVTHPEEQWLNNSKLEYKKIMLILDEQQQQQQQIQNFSIQNKSEMISNTFNSSDINCSQRFQLDDLNYKLRPHFEDKNTQTQLKDLQKNLIDRLSQPKSRCSSRTNENSGNNPYWKLREVDQQKRQKRK